MTGVVGVTYRIMPISPETNLEDIKNKISEVMEPKGANKMTFNEEPIAFGLKAIIFMFQWSEEKELDGVEQMIKNMENVQSVQMIDIRKIA